MAKKKPRLRAKLRRTKRKISTKKLSKSFLLLLASAIFILFGIYLIYNSSNTPTIKETPIIETKKESVQEFLKEKKIFEEMQIFEDKAKKKADENGVNEEHFEEKNFELEKSYIEENKEDLNQKIINKIEEIKKSKEIIETQIAEDKKETIEQIKEKENIADKEPLKEKKVVEKKDTFPKYEEVKKDAKEYDEKSIITSKDKFIFNQKNKAKLAIIIDDVSTQAQKNSILSIGYPVTMAFLPPANGHKQSAQIAQDVPFHMIHFPMQASSAFKGPEENTLKITDSYEQIEQRVKQLRAWYPKAKYTNNHTGSVFTENDEAMGRLYKALDKYGFIFVDSRTSAKSVAKKYSYKYNMPYIVRNTFLDNDRNFQAVQKQLLDAVRIAKKQGYAVAIGHPYDITIKVLKESKHLLKDVELIYLNKLPYL